QRYVVNAGDLAGLTRTEIATITFLLKGAGAKTLKVDWGTFQFTGEVGPDPTKDVNDRTLLPPLATGSQPNPLWFYTTPDATADLNLTSANRFTFSYQGTLGTSFGGVAIDYDIDGTPATETINLSALFASGLIFSLRSADTDHIAFEIKDINGQTSLIQLVSIQDLWQTYWIPLASFNNVDLTQIVSLTFVLQGAANHTIEVDWGEFEFQQAVQGTALNAALHTLLPGQPVVRGIGGNIVPGNPVGVINLIQESAKKFNFVYDLLGSDNTFVYAEIDVDDIALAEGTFGVKGPAGAYLKVEIVDQAGKKAIYYLELTGDFQNYHLDGTNGTFQSGFDPTHIESINFVMDSTIAGGNNTGTIEIMTDGLFYAPQVTGTAYAGAQLTNIPGLPVLMSGTGNTVAGQPEGEIDLFQGGATSFEYAFDLSQSPTSFVFAFLQPAAPIVLPESFVIAVKGREGSQVKVEIKDADGTLIAFILNLKAGYQNFAMDLSAASVPSNFDRTQVQSIAIVTDRSLAGTHLSDVVNFYVKGLNYVPPDYPDELDVVRTELITQGLDYFQTTTGIDPVTHFPYDGADINGTPEEWAKFTQPTLIGFYLQILGDAVRGLMDFHGWTKLQLLNEINTVMDSLLAAQTSFGWNGLLPFLDLSPYQPLTTVYGIGDNANLAQSLAVMEGAIRIPAKTTAERTVANAIYAKITQFLDNQEPGFVAAVHPTFGVFWNSYDTATGQFSAFHDRSSDEFRGGIAFLAAYFDSIPDSVFLNLATNVELYRTAGGEDIANLASFDGSAFQIFWPSLRNDESDHIDYRNALYNQFVSQADYAARYRIPGFISAAEIPENAYVGDLGIRDISEVKDFEEVYDPLLGAEKGPLLTTDVGSTYALASAYSIAPQATLEWLAAIREVPNLFGVYGLVDSARSSTEFARRFLGIDIASTVLGLSGAGPEDFDAYLRVHGLEQSYNLLYQNKGLTDWQNGTGIPKTDVSIATPPTFPDSTFNVFRNLQSYGDINGFPIDVKASGAGFEYGSLAGGYGGLALHLDSTYDARGNQLVIQYTAIDTPQQIKIELKDSSNQLLLTLTPNMIASGSTQALFIDIPNDAVLANVQKVILVIDQNATGDTSGDFLIHSMEFQHLP
ncbi:MAG: hypothetical protein ACOY3K_02030, partial [Candidatus Omnitrophota bacterium]